MWSDITEPADASDVARVLACARTAQPRCGSTLVVAVDGPSGSGKTTLALAVARELGAPVVHLDRIYPGWDGLAAAVGILTTHVLQPIARGERAAYPTWDWEHSRTGAVVEVVPTPVLVLDGCGCSALPAGRYAAVRVWLDGPEWLRRERAIARDGEVFAPHWEQWAAQERALFRADRTREQADLVLDHPATHSVVEQPGTGRP